MGVAYQLNIYLLSNTVAFVVTIYAAFVKVIFISRPFGVLFNLAVVIFHTVHKK